MNVLMQILKGGELALELGPIAVELAQKLKGLFSLSPDISVNLTTLEGEAISADDEALADISAWQKKHGLAD
jgi:hypothetical protein